MTFKLSLIIFRDFKQNKGKKVNCNFKYDLATFLFENNSCGFLE